MLLAGLILIAVTLGYCCYWAVLSHGHGILRPYLGHGDGARLRSQAWIRFLIVFPLCIYGVAQAMTETQIYRISFMPSMTLGYLIGHVHFLWIPDERWSSQRSRG